MANGSKWATGKNSVATSDRDGMKYPYNEMMVDPDTKSMVHRDEVDQPDPYRRLRSKQDAIALRNPRPDTNIAETLDTSIFDNPNEGS